MVLRVRGPTTIHRGVELAVSFRRIDGPVAAGRRRGEAVRLAEEGLTCLGAVIEELSDVGPQSLLEDRKIVLYSFIAKNLCINSAAMQLFHRILPASKHVKLAAPSKSLASVLLYQDISPWLRICVRVDTLLRFLYILHYSNLIMPMNSETVLPLPSTIEPLKMIIQERTVGFGRSAQLNDSNPMLHPYSISQCCILVSSSAPKSPNFRFPDDGSGSGSPSFHSVISHSTVYLPFPIRLSP